MAEITFEQFTETEDRLLLLLISNAGCKKQILRKIDDLVIELGRDKYVLIQRCFQLGLIQYKPFSCWLLSHRENGWRSDEIDFLIKYACESRVKLARALGRSQQSVSKQCFELRLNNGALEYPWSMSELTYLYNESQCLDIKSMRRALNRCTVDIKHKMIQIGINKHSTNPFTGRPPKRSEAEKKVIFKSRNVA